MNKQAPEYGRVKEKIAIFLVARDDEISLEEAAIMWDAWKRAAVERGHFGDCTNEPETCFRCLVSKVYEDVGTILSITGMAILADDQSLPRAFASDDSIKGVLDYQQDMLKAGFVKVI